MPQRSYIFTQFLSLLPRYEFQRYVNKYNGDYRAKRFKCWNQMACMIFAHIRQEDSLRDIDISLNAHASKLYHIGIDQCPKSTLADANEQRDYRIYEEFAKSLMQRARRLYSQTELAMEVDNAVYALDASTIDLTLSLFPWAKFRRTKGAVKLHAMIDLRGNIPAFLSITDGKVADIKAVPQIQIEPDGIYVVDRAYTDFAWLWSIEQTGAYFVTRLKKSIKWTRVISHPVDKSIGLRSDQEILLVNKQSNTKYPDRLRKVSFRDEDQDRTLTFLTNNFALPADKIAALYKARWEIGVSRQGHIIQSVKVRPGIKDSNPVAGEAPWRESKMVKPSDKLFRKEMMQGFRPQRTVNADVASLHANPVAETVYNARRQQEPFETSLIRRLSPAGYQRWHVARDDVSTGEALDVRRRNLVEEASPITMIGKWDRRRQGGGLGRSTDDRCAAKRIRRKGPRPVNHPFGRREAGAR